jgi:hydroxymethylbilane synthase
MAEAPIRLGTRGSALALAQAQTVADALGGAELVPIRTSGDASPAAKEGTAPAPGGDKARFVREIEQALLAGRVDLAVHSAKDLPTELPDGLRIAAVPAREDPADAFVGEAGSLDELPEGARIGTSSLRRAAQLRALRPDLRLAGLRGNVDTRLGRLAEGAYDGIVLAAAGLRRLGREAEIAFRFDPGQMTPAAGQGSLALEARIGRDAGAAALSDRAAEAELRAERATVAALGASCNTPLGVLARVEGERIAISAFCGLPDGGEWIRDRVAGSSSDPEAAGSELAGRMQGAGAGELLERAEKMAVVGA